MISVSYVTWPDQSQKLFVLNRVRRFCLCHQQAPWAPLFVCSVGQCAHRLQLLRGQRRVLSRLVSVTMSLWLFWFENLDTRPRQNGTLEAKFLSSLIAPKTVSAASILVHTTDCLWWIPNFALGSDAGFPGDFVCLHSFSTLWTALPMVTGDVVQWKIVNVSGPHLWA